eukprot:1724686-Pyramimonas_sp.AAC.1
MRRSVRLPPLGALLDLRGPETLALREVVDACPLVVPSPVAGARATVRAPQPEERVPDDEVS